MKKRDLSEITHDHDFLGANQDRNERKVWLVIALTATMMVVEIVAGHWFGSMALIADGWHMSTHAGAMLIAVLAYRYARRNLANPNFSFGTGKVGDLAGFASAVVLVLVALLIGWESLLRLVEPVPISFEQAIMVAVIGLAVNLLSAWLLRDDHHHHHGHAQQHHGHHHHGPDHPHGHGQDNNLRAAYLHVLADALTSVLAIVALLLGRAYGWYWADPIMGVVGAIVISRWSFGLIRDTGSVLLDRVPQDMNLESKVRETIEDNGDTITDLHIWQVGPGHYSVIVSIASTAPDSPSHYKAQLEGIDHLAHTTIEVHKVDAAA
ncbi:CDF family Co(II)/Ni(II) efflux transporter DmeF [Denitrobaculum tricleocarpae]|uniref:CDF family Co(II)/Ni(II) efflux transporter DmeF n=1 Tax=Denitrobaculum tricleocarpae TaxID=2591009 RepID=A0A545TKF1_9PROT|nr:CDF family Co(II)/Ni(II) efflux transporter DmeF [Denitrobaculum tricleocarpae]TQV77710.1 CDF family Co(II)/Ni(II) efflux transporter DmeF [Denitrobaculum tricleocarpae]